jgi:ThiF family
LILGKTMSQCISSRHESDLGGQFSPFGDVKPIGVSIIVPEQLAAFPAVQHTAWMLVNLLARFAGVVNRVSIQCPSGIPQSGRVVPLALKNTDFDVALLGGGRAIGVVQVERNLCLEKTIVVGPGIVHAEGTIFCLGSGWCGGFSATPDPLRTLEPKSTLPIGPYVAACLAAGEIFKAARMQAGTYESPASAFYSAYSHRASDSPVLGDPSIANVPIHATLAGVGAVGCAMLHALWACPQVSGTFDLVDNDPKGLEESNLNRYCLFGMPSVGQPKATAASALLSDSALTLTPFDVAIETHSISTTCVASAVDRNTARAAIQFKYPAKLFSASTSDLRAEVLRCGPPGVGACLRCFNEPERLVPDDDLRAKLKLANDAELVDLCRTTNITVADAKEWISTGRCGLAGEQLLSLLRRNEDEHEFAVAFVSVMAGTLLAAELIKDASGGAEALSENLQRATFQFFSPLAKTNRATRFHRDSKCPMCDPNSLATRLWQQRYQKAI